MEDLYPWCSKDGVNGFQAFVCRTGGIVANIQVVTKMKIHKLEGMEHVSDIPGQDLVIGVEHNNDGIPLINPQLYLLL